MVAVTGREGFGDVTVSSGERTKVIFASTLGTVFEWYDFYLYVVLAPAFAKLFFPAANDNAALLAAFATYGAGYVIRPLGAVFFGRMGDSSGRKYTFLMTIVFMGFSTFCVGLLPTFKEVGWLAPALLVVLRLVQGLAMGGEYGGAATYVAEYAEPGKRGLATSWIQASYVIGLIMALGLLLICRSWLGADAFASWGWRIPFIASFLLLIISVYVRLKLRETPVFQRLKAEGKDTKSPVAESFLHGSNSLYMVLAVFGAVGGAAVVTITANFYTLFFLSTTMQVDLDTTYSIMIPILTLSILTYLFFGWLSDKIGRLKVMLTGSFLAALTFIPLFHLLGQAVNPDLIRFQNEKPVTVTVDESTCGLHVFIGPWTKYTTCDHVGDILTKSGVNFTKVNTPGAENVLVSVGGQSADLSGTNKPAITKTLQRTLFAAGYPGLRLKTVNGEPQAGPDGLAFEPSPADLSKIDYGLASVVIFILFAYGAMTHSPLAVFLVELFPAKIRYVSMSFPYQIGYGWVGGNVPLVATAIVVTTGDIYAGLWYPVAVTVITVLIGFFFLKDRSKLSLYQK
jgi:MFS family permease